MPGLGQLGGALSLAGLPRGDQAPEAHSSGLRQSGEEVRGGVQPAPADAVRASARGGETQQQPGSEQRGSDDPVRFSDAGRAAAERQRAGAPPDVDGEDEPRRPDEANPESRAREDREARKSPENPQGLTESELAQVQELESRDREVRTHEQAHKAIAGELAGAISYTFQTGPDRRRYAVGGEVPIDVAPVAGDPAATIRKMERVQRAALAPAEPFRRGPGRRSAGDTDRRAGASGAARRQRGRGRREPRPLHGADRRERGSQGEPQGEARRGAGEPGRGGRHGGRSHRRPTRAQGRSGGPASRASARARPSRGGEAPGPAERSSPSRAAGCARSSALGAHHDASDGGIHLATLGGGRTP